MNDPQLWHLIAQAQRGSKRPLCEAAEELLDRYLVLLLDEGAYLPLWARVRIKRQLHTLHAKAATKGKVMRDKRSKAVEARRQAVKAATATALAVNRPQLVRLDPRYWASFIQERFQNAPAKYGLPEDYPDTAPESDINVIRQALDELKGNS